MSYPFRSLIADRETSLDIIREDAISIYREYLSDKVSGAFSISYSRKAVYNTMRALTIPEWLPNLITSAGLEPVLCNTEKSFIVSYNMIFSFLS